MRSDWTMLRACGAVIAGLLAFPFGLAAACSVVIAVDSLAEPSIGFGALSVGCGLVFALFTYGLVKLALALARPPGV